jgi:hypothetical protein
VCVGDHEAESCAFEAIICDCFLLGAEVCVRASPASQIGRELQSRPAVLASHLVGGAAAGGSGRNCRRRDGARGGRTVPSGIVVRVMHGFGAEFGGDGRGGAGKVRGYQVRLSISNLLVATDDT